MAISVQRILKYTLLIIDFLLVVNITIWEIQKSPKKKMK